MEYNHLTVKGLKGGFDHYCGFIYKLSHNFSMLCNYLKFLYHNVGSYKTV